MTDIMAYNDIYSCPLLNLTCYISLDFLYGPLLLSLNDYGLTDERRDKVVFRNGCGVKENMAIDYTKPRIGSDPFDPSILNPESSRNGRVQTASQISY